MRGESSATGRARLHWRVAEELQRVDPLRVREIADHYACGAAVGDLRTVAQAAINAAHSSISSTAFEEAASHARAALTALDRTTDELELRFEALRSTATQLVGRDEELDLLRRRWEQAKTGEGRVVLISGDAGIGKSRLAAAVDEATEDQPRTRLR